MLVAIFRECNQIQTLIDLERGKFGLAWANKILQALHTDEGRFIINHIRKLREHFDPEVVGNG
jgi:hypothetical protein